MDSDRRGQWLRGVLDICVLALLRERESYGYQLAQALDAAGVGPIQGGTLYPVLLRLQRTGLVTARWREGSAGPARKYYRLTDDGHAALRQGGSDWLTFVAPVNDIVTKGVAG
ncbi:PadR family transcriptional regulator [Micromonospora acroterricola]|uniref:PadR family transcriptional regulator n=1 Tax=Micromonospora acroterricola TaxID=2202421 RepID=A0A317CRT2_9ACTN|nr:PadR family transcriptional regulator [Micromonospora acroterricola]PWR05057.1 PadR family transcriptional regulator [Micromonospora acroterricola]